MRNHRSDVVATAMQVLDDYGLADLTMRRLAAELGVRPSALYHHVPSKQALLGLVADEVLTRPRPAELTGTWEEQVRTACHWVRDALLAWRDGAELVTTVHAFGIGAQAADEVIDRAVRASGLGEELAATAGRTLLHYVFGHTLEEQTRLQAASVGAIPDQPDQGGRAGEHGDFDDGLGLIVDGIAVAIRGDGITQSGTSIESVI